MSGIVGLLNLDGAPIDRALLERMTEFMTFRGPDDQQVWLEEAVGFGHTMLRTTWEAEYEHQPFTLDRQVWIVADARIDDRAVLAQKLGIAPPPSPPFKKETKVITDVELILRAYLEWGDGCVDHLLGDFAFAIWDGRKQRLFCARDQFGVKLFYYSRVGNCLIISNTLNCIRQHPQVSSDLNEAAIGDFLLFGINHNIETTTFADIQKMPGAHTLTWSRGKGIETQQYWTLPMPELIRYKNPQDYIDRFRVLMGQAVGDRLRTEKVAISLSGGLDSSLIAATALETSKTRSQSLKLQAFTVVDFLSLDDERYYSGIVAETLGIPIQYVPADTYELFEGWDRPELQTPEPLCEPLSIIHFNFLNQIRNQSRVALWGHGANEALQSVTAIKCLKFMSPLEVIGDVANTVFTHHLRPPIGSRLFTIAKKFSRDPDVPNYPDWINPSFADRIHLPERWHQIKNSKVEPTDRYLRSSSLESITSVLWIPGFEINDPGFTHLPIEPRLPFFDLRLLDYCLSLPPIPWCISKQILRIAISNILPSSISQRPKSSPLQDQVCEKFAQSQATWHKGLKHPSLIDYIDMTTLLSKEFTAKRQLYWNTWEQMRIGSLGYWLTNH